MLAQVRAQDRGAAQLLNGVKSSFDLGHIDRRREQAAAKQAAAHAGAGAVEHVEQRRFLGLAREQRLDQFQIADGSRIENERVSAVIKSRPLQVIERGALGIAEIVQDRGGGAGCQRMGLEAAAVEREQMEVIAQAARGVIGREDPGVHIGFEAGKGIGRSFRNERFACVQSFKRRANLGGVDLGGAKLAGGDIDVRDARSPIRRHHGRQVVILVRAQHLRVHRGAGRDDAGDLAPDKLGGGAGNFHLIADGDAVALLDQARDVVFGGVIRHAAHRNRLALFLVARGERDFELAGGGDGVVVEQLVEVAEPEHQQRVRHLLLDAVVLPHEWSGGVGGHREVQL